MFSCVAFMASNFWIRLCCQRCGSLIDFVSTHVSVMPWLVGVVIVFAITLVHDYFLIFNSWIVISEFIVVVFNVAVH